MVMATSKRKIPWTADRLDAVAERLEAAAKLLRSASEDMRQANASNIEMMLGTLEGVHAEEAFKYAGKADDAVQNWIRRQQRS